MFEQSKFKTLNYFKIFENKLFKNNFHINDCFFKMSKQVVIIKK